MQSDRTIDRRLTTLEQTVANLQQHIGVPQPTSSNWLEIVMGSVSDESAFLEALEYGRQMREADRPNDRDDEDL